MEERFLYIAILIFFELYEASWQKGESFKGMIKNIFKKYENGQIYFFLSHPSYWFVLYTAIKYGISNFWMISIILLKTADIAFKLWLIQSKIKGKEIDDLGLPQDFKISPGMIYLNTVVYTILFYFALF